MADITKAEKLAVMGLRVILKIYDHHPNTVSVMPKDMFPQLQVKPNNIATDVGVEPQSVTDNSLYLGDVLLRRMLQEGVISGTGGLVGISGASIPPHVRRALTEQAGGTSNIADMLRDELTALDAGEERPPGTFTRYAQDIGFQP